MSHPTGELTDREREMLRFSPLIFEFAGHREQAILDKFGMSATSFSLALVRLIDREEAIAFAPLECARLRRIRDARREGL